nr:PTS sugar transporter subunit IIA [Streptococcus uberis]
MVDGNRKTLSAINNYDFVNQSLIRNLIGNRIYLSKDCRNVTDSIYYLVNNNLSKENHTKEFLESIFDREKLGSTSVYTGIALPHSSPNTVQCSQLSFLSLKNPILWGDNMIKVIMLIAIKEGEEELYKDALIYIYSKIDNQVFINQLANANTSEEFMEVLLGKV